MYPLTDFPSITIVSAHVLNIFLNPVRTSLNPTRTSFNAAMGDVNCSTALANFTDTTIAVDKPAPVNTAGQSTLSKTLTIEVTVFFANVVTESTTQDKPFKRP